MSNLDILKKGIKKDKAPIAIKRLKLRTLTNPTDASAWYELALYLLDLENNQSAWVCLTNAKKLGSVEAMEKIKEILEKFNKNTKALKHFIV